MEYIINTTLTILIAVLWLKVLLTYCYRYTLLQKQVDWIEKKAVVKDCRIISNIGKSNFMSSKSRASFFAVFEDKGKQYGVRKISVCGNKSTFEKSIVSTLKIGDQISVYCNKNNPMENILCPKKDQTAIDITGMIATLALTAIQFLLSILTRLF
jgi:hypothetical protein